MTEQTDAPARPLYDRLRRIQLDNGWTVVQLAEKAGVARGTIDNWKTQPRSPLPATVKDVAKKLGIPYREALALAGIETADSPVTLRLAERLAELDERLSVATEPSEGTVRLTVHVNPSEPEPDYPPGGLRNQAERIIWAMVDEPWQVRLAQILAGREAETLPEVKSTERAE
ncbi:helix-turn-helix domain-containing protein [Actinomadura sp. KC216]|uniref:helix-turn-helix domain-containing protein n=1 Tax=Actinomadura sp. KC216 TaxID=2530370 RepID=UPI0010449BB7|nr:helix-turn-helix transcriptional regulator [Actinomadura sp. KC216]TDB83433.1 helix-turn-helix domain-containing protein [Actinomadura sp. KC216]